MRKFVRCSTVALGAAASLVVASAALAINTSPFRGEAGDLAYFDRVITIAPATKWVNVTRGETVKFVDSSSGQSFVWRFDTPTWATVDLTEPNGRHILAYVANDPEDNSD